MGRLGAGARDGRVRSSYIWVPARKSVVGVFFFFILDRCVGPTTTLPTLGHPCFLPTEHRANKRSGGMGAVEWMGSWPRQTALGAWPHNPCCGRWGRHHWAEPRARRRGAHEVERKRRRISRTDKPGQVKLARGRKSRQTNGRVHVRVLVCIYASNLKVVSLKVVSFRTSGRDGAFQWPLCPSRDLADVAVARDTRAARSCRLRRASRYPPQHRAPSAEDT